MRKMNKVLPTLSLMMLVSAVGSTRVQAQAFEGTLTFLAHGKDGDKTITEWVKGTNTRYDFSGAASGGAQGAMIIDGAARTRTVIMPARKMYMTVPYDPNAKKPRPGEKSDVTWTRTGKTETVAGVKCDVIGGVGTENGKPREVDICVARGIGFGSGSTGGGPFSEALSEYANLDLAPGEGVVKMTSVENGKPRVDLVLTRVDRRALSAADFQPPAGYTKFERPAAMSGPPPVQKR